MLKAAIFDLDGVLVFTDKFHYAAWKAIADKYGIYFDESINNKLRGVSRMESLDIILENSGKTFSKEEKEKIAEEKNEIYKKHLETLTAASISEEVKITLEKLKEKGVKLAVGSSSKNAKAILSNTGMLKFFDAVSDGTNITMSKPHPEVFLKAAKLLNTLPEDCLVVEDAHAGIIAAVRGGFASAGMGDAFSCKEATLNIKSISEIINLFD